MRTCNLIASACIALATISAPVASVAQETISSIDAARKVNIAGRQRMLSQRIVKATCLASAHINFGQNFNQLDSAVKDFEKAHNGLLNGDRDLGLNSESFDVVVDALFDVEDDWLSYLPHVEKAINTGEISVADVLDMNASSETLLVNMNTAVGVMAQEYGDQLSNVSIGLTVTMDIAGRQRMLSQKMTKEMCIMFLDAGSKDAIASLSKTIQLFDASMNALVDGYPAAGVMRPPNDAVEASLTDVREIWNSLKPLAELAASGEVPSAEAMKQFSISMENVLLKMNEAVSLYQTSRTS